MKKKSLLMTFILQLCVAGVSAQNYEPLLYWQAIDETTAAITGFVWQQANVYLDDPTPLQTDIYIPSSVTDENGTFTVTMIADRAFSNTEWITSVNMPATIRTIGVQAFAYSEDLTTITIPESVVEIGDGVCWQCEKLTSAYIPSSVSIIPNLAFAGCIKLTDVFISAGVNVINYAAFKDCTALSGIMLPEGLQEIQYSAFDGCSSLESIHIPSTVTVMGNYYSTNVFTACSNLQRITVHAENPVYDSRNDCNAIIKTDEAMLVTGCAATAFSSKLHIKRIGNSAFYKCEGLTDLHLPESIEGIGNSAFAKCQHLTNVTLPSYLTELGNEAFYECSSLTSIAIPEGVTSLASGTFNYCSSLKTIYLPSTMNNIGSAFGYGNALENIYCFAVQPPTLSSAFYTSNYENSILHVPSSAIATYKGKYPWYNFKNIVGMTGGELPVQGLFENSSSDASEFYTIDGRRTSVPSKGIHIIRRTDGTTQKVFIPSLRK